AHGFFQALYVAIDIAVQKFEEEAEILRVAFVRRSSHQQIMVRHGRQRLAKMVVKCLLARTVGAHLMCFIDDDEVPTAAEQAVFGSLNTRDAGYGSDDLVLFLPGVGAIIGPEHITANDLELLAELVFHFPLPLEREISRGDNQRAFDQSPDFEFLEEQPGHDSLTCPRVVRQEETDTG